MKLLSALVLSLGMSSSAFAVDRAYYEIKSVQVKEVTTHYAPYMDLYSQPGMAENCGTGNHTFKTVFAADVPSVAGAIGAATGTDLNPLDTVEVIVDKIINIGKKIWNIVEAGKPVVNIKVDTANALPTGITCWTDMEGWGMPQTKVFSVQYQNGFGMNVVSFDYRLTFTGKGNVNGIGQYITNATFMPAKLNVAWGFTFNAVATIPSVFNQGTKQAPLAGMQMNMQWSVDSPIVHNEQAESYFVSGDNQMVHLQ